MYCPKCATQNIEGAKFCRSCGADISLVPQVLSGELAERLAVAESAPETRHRRRRGREKEPPSMDKSVRNIIMGVGFLIVALSILFLTHNGANWWWAMLFPAFGLVSDGVAGLLRLKQEQQRLSPPPFVAPPPAFNAPPRQAELPPRDAGQFAGPTSVTEGTTRHLGVPADRAPKDV